MSGLFPAIDANFAHRHLVDKAALKQQTFASLSYQSKNKRAWRERFLAETDQVLPWRELVTVIEPHYPKNGRRGRPPMPLETMPWMHFMQQWHAMGGPPTTGIVQVWLSGEVRPKAVSGGSLLVKGAYLFEAPCYFTSECTTDDLAGAERQSECCVDPKIQVIVGQYIG